MGVRIVIENKDNDKKKIIVAEVEGYSCVWYQVDHLARRILRLLENDGIFLKIDNKAPYRVYKDKEGDEVIEYI